MTIHYNLQYHAANGSGGMLTSQYHPYEESIFMTDAHALLAVALAGLRPIIPNIDEYAVGISNVAIFWASPFAVLFLFLTFRQLKVRWILALVFSVLIAMMSPQILRQLGGQYTLGFTWMLPMTIWYIISWNDGKRYWLKSVAVALAIYLLGMNNPYMYAISGAFLLATSAAAILVKLAGNKTIAWARIFHWLGVFAATTAGVFLTLEIFDVVEDRVEVPFGFFHNMTTWGGLLSSNGVFPYDFMHGIFPDMAKPRYENQLYMGLIPILFALSLPFVLFLPKVKEKVQLAKKPILLIAMVGGLAGMIFGFGLPFSYFKYWTYDHLGAVLQFRAPVRFGWPLYYLLAISAGYALSRLFEEAKNKKLAALLLVLPILIWGVEAHQFLNGNLKDRVHGSPFTQAKLDAFRNVAANSGIDTANYSSIFLLPTELGWTDKVHHNGTWRSNHDGYSMSLATGLPLLNGKLSRLSLKRCLQSLQVTTHPLVRKEILDLIDRDKSILLLAANDNNLDPPERRLRDLGTSVYKTDQLELFRLDPNILQREHEEALAAIPKDTMLTNNFHRFAYEHNKDFAFYGEGSQRVGNNWQDVMKLSADSLQAGTSYNISFWVYADGRRFGGPKMYIGLFDAENKKLTEQYQWINRVYETQEGWQRVEFIFEVPQEATMLKLISNHEHPYYVDEVLVRPEGRSVYFEGKEVSLYNNYLVERR